jgi:hypothetical protein
VALDLNGFSIFIINQMSDYNRLAYGITDLSTRAPAQVGVSVRNGSILTTSVPDGAFSVIRGVFLSDYSSIQNLTILMLGGNINASLSTGTHSRVLQNTFNAPASVTCPSVIVQNVGDISAGGAAGADPCVISLNSK